MHHLTVYIKYLEVIHVKPSDYPVSKNNQNLLKQILNVREKSSSSQQNEIFVIYINKYNIININIIQINNYPLSLHAIKFPLPCKFPSTIV